MTIKTVFRERTLIPRSGYLDPVRLVLLEVYLTVCLAFFWWAKLSASEEPRMDHLFCTDEWWKIQCICLCTSFTSLCKINCSLPIKLLTNTLKIWYRNYPVVIFPFKQNHQQNNKKATFFLLLYRNGLCVSSSGAPGFRQWPTAFLRFGMYVELCWLEVTPILGLVWLGRVFQTQRPSGALWVMETNAVFKT